MAAGDQPGFAELQQRLAEAWRADLPGSSAERLIVALPSYSVDPTLLLHYADRLPAIEHRYLMCLLLLENPATHVAFLTGVRPPDHVVQMYLDLLPDRARATAADRIAIVAADDPAPKPLAEKLLARDDLVEKIKALAAGRPAMIEAFNVTAAERDLALALDIPINGAAPELWPLGTKSASRRLFRDEGVPLPDGVEEIRNSAQIVSAICEIRGRQPSLKAVVVKLNDSGAGDGNAVIDLSGLPPPGAGDERDAVAARLLALPGWYMEQLALEPGIVEARIDGTDYRSPSCQLNLTPHGDAVVLSTHEQVLGGHSGQVYQGCSAPAHPDYAAELASHSRKIASRLAAAGVVGRIAIDFVAVRGAHRNWDLYALEINLRKGGTTHPLATARILTGFRYDAEKGIFTGADGRPVQYVATDNLVDPAWRSVDPAAVVPALRDAGVFYSRDTRSGVVPHMLTCLPIDGRMGLTAIAEDLDSAQKCYDRAAGVVASLVR